jgi:hypothetical protein
MFDVDGKLIDAREIIPFPSLAEQLQALGWQPGPPTRFPLEALAVDAKCCAEMICGGCGCLGLEHLAFHKDQVYRVVAACPKCEFEEEF